MAIYDKTGNEVSAAFAANGTEAAKAYNAGGVQVHSNVHTLKVMTYNVGTWYDGKHDNIPAAKDAEYYALQKGMIQADDADIICMEEYCKEFSKSGRMAADILVECGYPYIIETLGDSPTARPANGRCIASRYPIRSYVLRAYTDGSKLYYDTCVVTIHGVSVHLIITHMHWNDRAKRTSEMQTIMSLLAGFDRFILCGDFNTTDNYDTDGADYVAIIKPLIDAGYNVANGGDFGFKITYSSYPDNSWTACLDNIVTSPNIEMLGVVVDETKLNDGITTERVDHLPLIATLQI